MSSGNVHLHQLAENLLGCPTEAPVPVRGGGNSRVFRLDGRDGGCWALKCYPPPEEHRNRLKAEYDGLNFLVRRGIDRVPCPVAFDASENVAIYSWIEGTAVVAPTESDLLALAEFSQRLLANADDEARYLPNASEACPSVVELIGQLRCRLDRLGQISGEWRHQGFADFLCHELEPATGRYIAEAEMACRAAGLDVAAELPMARLTLSPSDFGVHNALRHPDGGLCFLDFEYFGWDDPAKLVADLLLHPGMILSAEAKRLLCARMTSVFAAQEGFFQRLRILYPLYGLRWCMIILNEFLPEVWQRRALAGAGDWAAAQDRQLAKATNLLLALNASRGRFIHDA